MTTALARRPKSLTIHNARVDRTARLEGVWAIYEQAYSPRLLTGAFDLCCDAPTSVVLHGEQGSGLIWNEPDELRRVHVAAAGLNVILTAFDHIRTNFYFAPSWESVSGTAELTEPRVEDIAFGRYLAEVLTYQPPFSEPTEDDIRPQTGFVFPE